MSIGDKTRVHTLDKRLPIGVFDSGIGGFTVASALRQALPDEALLYLGDVARLPYGTKSPETVARYALQGADFLVRRGVKMLVVACNTASAHALPALAAAHPGLPVLGVIEAGAEAAAKASRSGRIAVIATEGTCSSGAFGRAIAACRPDSHVLQIPCPLFVPLAEEGLTDGPIAEDIARHYLGDTFASPQAPDTLVLGCTHFPLLAATLRRVAGDGPAIVDCATAVAAQARRALAESGMAAPAGPGAMHLVTTDAPDRFMRVARLMFPSMPDLTPELANLLPS